MTQASAQRPRTDWYQTDAYVSVSVFVKGVADSGATRGVVGDDGRTVTLSYELAAPADQPDQAAGLHSLELRLSHPVAADSLQVSVKPTRLDVRLNKLHPGVRWAVLEGSDDSAARPPPPPPQPSPSSSSAAAPNPQQEQPEAPPQPHHKAKNWDAIAKSIEDDKLEGDAALNDLFQKIYGDGTDEQRKAMVKSFTESGGTVLSTNWNEVGQSKVEVKPPDGMEYKKWDV